MMCLLTCSEALYPPDRSSVSVKEGHANGGTLELVIFAKLHNYLVAKHVDANALDVGAIVVVHDAELQVY